MALVVVRIIGKKCSFSILNREPIGTIDPVQLVGLRQAVYVMDCLATGQSKEEITKGFGDDMQLVAMWILFLKHNHWIAETKNGWSITAKGTLLSRRITSA